MCVWTLCDAVSAVDESVGSCLLPHRLALRQGPVARSGAVRQTCVRGHCVQFREQLLHNHIQQHVGQLQHNTDHI